MNIIEQEAPHDEVCRHDEVLIRIGEPLFVVSPGGMPYCSKACATAGMQAHERRIQQNRM
jgi:hypothetical protein